MWGSGPYQEIKNRADMARRIALEEILKRSGCLRYRFDKTKWRTPQGTISIRGEKFFNWTAAIGGGGAIDLVIHLMDYDFKSAVSWLSGNFSLSDLSDTFSNPKVDKNEINHRNHSNGDSKTLRLPPRDDGNLLQIRYYLMHLRCLPKTVVDYLIDRGVLYADNKGNAVFLLLGKGKRVVGAEIRGTNDCLRKWHAVAAGTKKHKGCFYVRDKRAKKLVLCESAIDAISYFVLYPKCMAASTSGVSPNPHWINHFMDSGFEIFCAFDSDEAGERTANKMRELYPAVKRLRPKKHDWNEVLKSKNS
ncbi:MAG: DUF3991 domain-containing protein [Deltaproteobacteria bacterium]|nr:DUF3991 domain-containing protein [Deltaproteobacteria bacterium]